MFLAYFGALQSAVKQPLYSFPFGLFAKKSFLRLGCEKRKKLEVKSRVAWEAGEYFSS